MGMRALSHPVGTQGDDNLDRPLPWPAQLIRSFRCLGSTSSRHDLDRRGGAARLGRRSSVAVVPHTIPEWEPPARDGRPDRPFTVGFAGRLVPQKGIDDLLAACRRLDGRFRLLVVGDGPLRPHLESADLGFGELELHAGVRSDEMPALYAEMDVLVLPSRTTATWAEQFGKVLCEALLCGVPVIGARSGEIPWVIQTSGGGRNVPRA